MTTKYHCRRCGTGIQGNSVLCVKCFAETAVMCTACCWRDAAGHVRLRRNGRGGPGVNCKACKNVCYISTWEGDNVSRNEM
jgi:hypothetical protein